MELDLVTPWMQLTPQQKRIIVERQMRRGITNIKEILELYNRGITLKNGGKLESKLSFRDWLNLLK